MSEATRLHRRGGGSSVKACKSPIVPRMAQSEAGASPAHTPALHRRRVRAGLDGASQVVLTDAPSSDFLGLPLPETIFSVKPGLGSSAMVGAGALSIAPELCSQQASMDDLTHFLSTAQPQWSLAQLSDMLGAGAPHPSGASDMIGGGNSSFYIDQTLADLGLGASSIAQSQEAGAATGAAANGGFETAAASLSELVDLPVDNDFSALLESFANGNNGGGGADADPYSSMGVGSSYGGLLSDDIMLELNSCMPISGPIGGSTSTGTASGAAVGGGGGRLIGARLNGGEIEIGSSSTITLMHDNSSLCSMDNVRPPQRPLPAQARPPPGMPGMMMARANSVRGILPRGGGGGGNRQVTALPPLPKPAALPTAISLSLPSNPPSTTGLGELDVGQLLMGVRSSSQMLDWSTAADAGGDGLEMELEGLINFDA
ncbi:hypothetical protein GGI21_004288 [Coemansia aciculifera]|nr:hypothetical protein GGI21_004288 [Coemansia aciculifera]